MDLFKIPDDVLQHHLPSQNLSILNLLYTKNPTPGTKVIFVANEAYISDQLPNATAESMEALLSIPPPSPVLVQELISCLQSNSSQSLACHKVHSAQPLFFPLWVVTYWREINGACEIKDTWSRANQFLQRLPREFGDAVEITELLKSVYSALAKLPWSGSVQGFTDRSEITHLHRYTTRAWLQTVHINQMLNLLESDLISGSENAQAVQIKSAYFMKSLNAARSRGQTPARKGPLNATGEALMSGAKQYLATVANCWDNHWVAIIIDFKHQTVWHGDSLALEMDPKLQSLLEWWISQYSSSAFTYHPLPITHQLDTFSCGLLAANALAHFLLPDSHQLVNAADVMAERLRIFLRICTIQQERGVRTSLADFKFEYAPLHSQITPSDGATKDSDFEMVASHLGKDDTVSSSSQCSDSDDDAITDDDELPTAPAPPRKKVHLQSSLSLAIKDNHAPLLAFFKPCTRAEYSENLAREREAMGDTVERERLASMNEKAAKEKLIRKREKTRLHQERLRANRKENEILQGIRSPGGRKRKVNLAMLYRPLSVLKRFQDCDTGICSFVFDQKTQAYNC
jgi:hypothetical protein